MFGHKWDSYTTLHPAPWLKRKWQKRGHEEYKSWAEERQTVEGSVLTAPNSCTHELFAAEVICTGWNISGWRGGSCLLGRTAILVCHWCNTYKCPCSTKSSPTMLLLNSVDHTQKDMEEGRYLLRWVPVGEGQE